MHTEQCEHFEQLTTVVAPTSTVCQTCIEMGDTWVHLRACLECGTVGCCDNSKNRHARAHWGANQHFLMQSIEPGESWRYCFEDDYLVK